MTYLSVVIFSIFSIFISIFICSIQSFILLGVCGVMAAAIKRVANVTGIKNSCISSSLQSRGKCRAHILVPKKNISLLNNRPRDRTTTVAVGTVRVGLNYAGFSFSTHIGVNLTNITNSYHACCLHVRVCSFLCLCMFYICVLWCHVTLLRKNQVFEFIPDRLPEFPIKKFTKVSGEAFFIDENLLVTDSSL